MGTILKEGYVIRVKRRPNVPVEDDYFIVGDKVIDKDYVFINPTKSGCFSIYSSDSKWRSIEEAKQYWKKYGWMFGKEYEYARPFIHFFDTEHPEICKMKLEETEEFLEEL